MSILVQRVPINTNGLGDAVRDVRIGGGVLLAVEVEVGTLTTPDITLTDEPSGVTLLDVAAVAADARYPIAVEQVDNAGSAIAGSAGPATVFGRIHVVIAGAGASKTGELTLLIER